VQRNTGATLFVVAQDLQLDGQVDLAHADAPRHGEYNRSEVEDARDPSPDEAVGGILGRCRRRGDDTDADVALLHDLVEVVDVADANAADDAADLRRLDVDHAGDGKTALAETAVAGQGLAEVTGADDDDRPIVGQAQLAPDLVDEEGDLVADAPSSVAAEVGKVFANLGGIDPGQLGQALAADALEVLVGLLDQDAEVDGKAGNGGLWYPTSNSFNWHRPPRYALVHTFTKRDECPRCQDGVRSVTRASEQVTSGS
jgi:hypothetical protein